MVDAQTVPQSAAPILASSLLGEEDLDDIIATVFRGVPQRRAGERLVAGVKSVDDVLGGGLGTGDVVGVSGSDGGGKEDLCFAFLTTFLLRQLTCSAAIIDTTGNLDLLRLYHSIFNRITTEPECVERLKKAPACELLDVEDLAAKALERVKIMRVFDLVGVLEAVGEIGEGMRVDRAGFKEDEVRKVELEIKESEQKKSGQEEKQGRRTVVMDSEDEDEDMLFDAPSEPDVAPTIPEGGKGIPVAHTPNPRPLQNDHADESTENTTNPAPERISFILIDNLAHIVSPLLRKDEDQANTLTPHILRTLSNLTHNHGLYTVLLNLVSHIPQPSAYNKSKTGQDIAPAALPSPPSIFPDNKTVPVLSELLTPWLDMHLLVDKVAKGKEDARKMTEGRKRDVETVSVVEVLADRWGGREGGWGVIG